MLAMRKVAGAVLGLAFAGVLFAEPIQEGYHNIKDRFIWAELQKELTDSNVASVRVGRLDEVALATAAKKEFLEKLQQAEFESSNWRRHGPTPENHATVVFKDGSFHGFGYWGGGTFETSFWGSQFLIESRELGEIVERNTGNR
ncbi:hypothetical protein [Effusibacillus consociatus]|uniref:Uncharacterized protein n=1 Tax=Effusibacillus consociatus TaxID=1117041 RepID=A0ABV9PUU1_9BACL